MTIAVAKNSEGFPYVISNVIKNSAGVPFTVSNVVKASDADPFTVFGTTISTAPAVAPIGEVFALEDSRYFYA